MVLATEVHAPHVSLGNRCAHGRDVKLGFQHPAVLVSGARGGPFAVPGGGFGVAAIVGGHIAVAERGSSSGADRELVVLLPVTFRGEEQLDALPGPVVPRLPATLLAAFAEGRHAAVRHPGAQVDPVLGGIVGDCETRGVDCGGAGPVIAQIGHPLGVLPRLFVELSVNGDRASDSRSMQSWDSTLRRPGQPADV